MAALHLEESPAHHISQLAAINTNTQSTVPIIVKAVNLENAEELSQTTVITKLSDSGHKLFKTVEKILISQPLLLIVLFHFDRL